MTEGTSADSTIDWAAVELPDAWPDRLDWSRPGTPWRLVRHVLGRARARVELPPGMPGAEINANAIATLLAGLPRSTPLAPPGPPTARLTIRPRS